MSSTLVHSGSFAWYPSFYAPGFSTDCLPGEAEQSNSVLDIGDFADVDGARVAAICQRPKTLCVVLSLHEASKSFIAISRPSFIASLYVLLIPVKWATSTGICNVPAIIARHSL